MVCISNMYIFLKFHSYEYTPHHYHHSFLTSTISCFHLLPLLLHPLQLGMHIFILLKGLSSESPTSGLISNQKIFLSLCLSPPFLLLALSVAFNTIYYPFMCFPFLVSVYHPLLVLVFFFFSFLFFFGPVINFSPSLFCKCWHFFRLFFILDLFLEWFKSRSLTQTLPCTSDPYILFPQTPQT